MAIPMLDTLTGHCSMCTQRILYMDAAHIQIGGNPCSIYRNPF
jgi:hypothetical protein